MLVIRRDPGDCPSLLLLTSLTQVYHFPNRKSTQRLCTHICLRMRAPTLVRHNCVRNNETHTIRRCSFTATITAWYAPACLSVETCQLVEAIARFPIVYRTISRELSTVYTTALFSCEISAELRRVTFNYPRVCVNGELLSLSLSLATFASFRSGARKIFFGKQRILFAEGERRGRGVSAAQIRVHAS